MSEKPQGEWEGTPLQMYHDGINPYGIKEIVVEFDTGEEEILKPRLGEEFGAYELQQTSLYLDSLVAELNARQS
jgi:hypothetical protein